jgi:hypothetical protein
MTFTLVGFDPLMFGKALVMIAERAQSGDNVTPDLYTAASRSHDYRLRVFHMTDRMSDSFVRLK